MAKGDYFKVCSNCGSLKIGLDKSLKGFGYGAPSMYKCNNCGTTLPFFPEVAEEELESYVTDIKNAEPILELEEESEDVGNAGPGELSLSQKIFQRWLKYIHLPLVYLFIIYLFYKGYYSLGFYGLFIWSVYVVLIYF